VCDHVEILYDVDIAFRNFAAERGMRLYRAESLNDSRTFVGAVANIVRVRMAAIPASDGTVAREKLR
jgi:ferrochelatase